MTCCPCDETEHPSKPDIPAGLTELPRQLAGFSEFRRALLASLPVQEVQSTNPLEAWRAREGDDLGIMLLDMWSYVLDVLSFYDERIANETYLRTASRRPSLRKLVGLLGFHAKPGVGSRIALAATAGG